MKKFKEFLVENQENNLNLFINQYNFSKSDYSDPIPLEEAINSNIIKLKIKEYSIDLEKLVPMNESAYLSFEKNNYIESKYFLNEIDFNFYCANMDLEELILCPKIVNGWFDCSHNRLSSLKECPQKVMSSFFCNNNQIISLQYCPDEIGGYLECKNNPLTDISNIINKKIKYISQIDYNKLNITIENLKALKQTNKIDEIDWYVDTIYEEELQLNAIKKNPENIKKISNPVDEVIDIIKRDYPELIRYLPYDKQTKLTRYGL